MPRVDVYVPVVPDPVAAGIAITTDGVVVQVPLQYWKQLINYIDRIDLVILTIFDIIEVDNIPNIIWEQ